MRIQHNIPGMNSYRHYANNVSQVSKNLEKLSSGYKINRAGDDAAGLAISEKMRIQITGLERAQSNAKSGINLVQTAEGALTEVHDMLNRMYDLAEQSANGTFDDSTDRAQIQKEINSLISEIDRIADATNYNGIQLLDGSMENKTVASGSVDVSLDIKRDGQLAGKDPQVGVFTADLGKQALVNHDTTDSNEVTFKIGVDDVVVEVGAGATLSGTALAQAIVDSITADKGSNVITDQDGNEYTVTAEEGVLRLTMKDLPKKSMDEALINLSMDITDGLASDKVTSNQGTQWHYTVKQEPMSSGDGRVYAQAEMSLTADIVKDGGTLTIGDETYVFAIGKKSVYKDYANVIDLTDKTADSDELLRTAAARLTQVAANNKSFYVGTDFDKADPKITFTEKEGAIDYSKNNLAGADNKSPGTHTDTDDATDADWAGLIMMGNANASASTHGLNLQIGDTAESFNKLRVSVTDMHAASLGIGELDVSKQEKAQSAMDAIKKATNMVSDARGGLGALQNRLDHTINSLSVAQENIQDSESTIRDVDVAKEMMAYTKNNILVQSAQAMLAQANQLPQGVLQLLG